MAGTGLRDRYQRALDAAATPGWGAAHQNAPVSGVVVVAPVLGDGAGVTLEPQPTPAARPVSVAVSAEEGDDLRGQDYAKQQRVGEGWKPRTGGRFTPAAAGAAIRLVEEDQPQDGLLGAVAKMNLTDMAPVVEAQADALARDSVSTVSIFQTQLEKSLHVVAPPPVQLPDTLEDLPIGQHPHEYLCGTAGCLHGDTSVIYLRGCRNGGRPTSLADLYRKFNGLPSTRAWDLSLPTYLHSLGDDGVMFYNKVVAVYESGVKSLVRLEVDGERGLRATADHPIMTPNGFVPAGDLKVGQTILAKGTMRAQSSGGRDLTARPPRVIINTKWHPFGAYKRVEGVYEYMRVPRARLVVEADLNGLPYDEFVHALKHNQALSATFRYIPTDFEVHHEDENTLNDEIGNLVVMTKAEHARLHNQQGNFRFDSYHELAVTKIEAVAEAMTYDVQMESPANNFCANDIVVHNTGKTTLARRLYELSPDGSVVLAATTGIAAVNLGEGTTINALLGFFDAEDAREKFQHGALQRMLRKHRSAGLRRIILDEVSMLGAETLTVLTRAIDEVNQPRSQSLESVGVEELDGAPGDLPPQIGLTLVGDFGQLPPVSKPSDPQGFAFESAVWPKYAEHITKLETIWRQADKPFIEALHAVRRGDVPRALTFFTGEKFSPETDYTFNGTTIFAKNDEVDRHNQLRLDRLGGSPMTDQAIRWGKPRDEWTKNIPDLLKLKVGALVMILANRRVPPDPDARGEECDGMAGGDLIYANGDLGELLTTEVNDPSWRVRLQRNGKVVRVLRVMRDNTIPLEPGRRKELTALGQSSRITEDGKREIIGTIGYRPLRCAYACTVHKTQGLTLDTVQINIRDPFFRHSGMLFVALSRCRTAEGLRIVGSPAGFAERVRTDPRVRPWL